MDENHNHDVPGIKMQALNAGLGIGFRIK